MKGKAYRETKWGFRSQTCDKRHSVWHKIGDGQNLYVGTYDAEEAADAALDRLENQTIVGKRRYAVTKVSDAEQTPKLASRLINAGYDGNIYLLVGVRGARRIAYRKLDGRYIITSKI